MNERFEFWCNQTGLTEDCVKRAIVESGIETDVSPVHEWEEADFQTVRDRLYAIAAVKRGLFTSTREANAKLYDVTDATTAAPTQSSVVWSQWVEWMSTTQKAQGQ